MRTNYSKDRGLVGSGTTSRSNGVFHRIMVIDRYTIADRRSVFMEEWLLIVIQPRTAYHIAYGRECRSRRSNHISIQYIIRDPTGHVVPMVHP